MGRTAALILLACALAGCASESAPVSAADAKKEILAPTDVKGLTPAQQRAVAGFAKANAAGRP